VRFCGEKISLVRGEREKRHDGKALYNFEVISIKTFLTRQDSIDFDIDVVGGFSSTPPWGGRVGGFSSTPPWGAGSVMNTEYSMRSKRNNSWKPRSSLTQSSWLT